MRSRARRKGMCLTAQSGTSGESSAWFTMTTLRRWHGLPTTNLILYMHHALQWQAINTI